MNHIYFISFIKCSSHYLNKYLTRSNWKYERFAVAHDLRDHVWKVWRWEKLVAVRLSHMAPSGKNQREREMEEKEGLSFILQGHPHTCELLPPYVPTSQNTTNSKIRSTSREPNIGGYKP